MAKKQPDPLNPDNTPNNIKQGKQLSGLAPALMMGLFVLILVMAVVAIVRRAPVVASAEEVEVIQAPGAPISIDGVGEIEEYKPPEAAKRKSSPAETAQVEALQKEIKLITAAKETAEKQKNIYWEQFKEKQLAVGKARMDNRLAAAQAESTVGGEPVDESTVKTTETEKAMEAIYKRSTSKQGYNGGDYEEMAQQMLSNQIALAGSGVPPDQNMQGQKNDFFNAEYNDKHTNLHPYVKVGMQSKYTLMEGEIIDGIMISGINSDLPGLITAHVSKNVYDSVTGKILLIPAGTELVGRYSSQVTYGQNKVAQGWTRMKYPDGSSVNLGNMAGSDQMGYSGLHDQVDNHYLQLFGGIALVSFFQAIPAIINPTESSSSQSTKMVTTTEQVVAGEDENGNPIIVTLEKTEPVTTTSSSSSGGSTDDFQGQFQESYSDLMSDAGVELFKKQLNVQPTLKIRNGEKFKIIVNRDMVLPPFVRKG